MSRNTLIAVIIVLSVLATVLFIRLKDSEYVPAPPPPEPEPEPEEEEEVLEPELEVLPNDYNPDGGLPGLVRVFDGDQEIQLAGGEEYECSSIEFKYVEQFQPIAAHATYDISSLNGEPIVKLRRDIDNAQEDFYINGTLEEMNNDIVSWSAKRPDGPGANDLDSLGALKFSWGLEKNVYAYTGAPFELTNSDGIAIDIPFVVDSDGFSRFDRDACLAHCGTGNGHITKLYDQKGSEDLVVPDNTLRIVENGEIFTDFSGIPTAKFVNTWTPSLSGISITDQLSTADIISGSRDDNLTIHFFENTLSTDSLRLLTSGGGNPYKLTVETSTFPSTLVSQINVSRYGGGFDEKFFDAVTINATDSNMVVNNQLSAKSNAYGSFSFDSWSANLTPGSNGGDFGESVSSFYTMNIFEDVIDYDDARDFFLPLYNYNANAYVVAMYDQAGDGAYMTFPVANNQPVYLLNGFYPKDWENQRYKKSVFGEYALPYSMSNYLFTGRRLMSIERDAPNECSLVIAFRCGFNGNRTYHRIGFDTGILNISTQQSGGYYVVEGEVIPIETSDLNIFVLTISEDRIKVFNNDVLYVDKTRSLGAFSAIDYFQHVDFVNQLWDGVHVSIFDRDISSQATEVYEYILNDLGLS